VVNPLLYLLHRALKNARQYLGLLPVRYRELVVDCENPFERLITAEPGDQLLGEGVTNDGGNDAMINQIRTETTERWMRYKAFYEEDSTSANDGGNCNLTVEKMILTPLQR
jgi:hypothetical protein